MAAAGQTHNKELQLSYQITPITETITFCFLMTLHWYQNTIQIQNTSDAFVIHLVTVIVNIFQYLIFNLRGHTKG